MNYRSRYYETTSGRFVSRDSDAGVDAYPPALQKYSYCLNNPVRFSDPLGLKVSMSDAAFIVADVAAVLLLLTYLRPFGELLGQAVLWFGVGIQAVEIWGMRNLSGKARAILFVFLVVRTTVGLAAAATILLYPGEVIGETALRFAFATVIIDSILLATEAADDDIEADDTNAAHQRYRMWEYIYHHRTVN